MVSKAFDYKAPGSVADAVALLAGTPGARALAGGQDLLNLLRLRRLEASVLVDLRNIAELKTISRISAPSEVIRIGAMATLSTIEANPDIRKSAVAFYEAVASVGDVATRNCSTLGGSISISQPANDVLAALLVLDAVVHVQGKFGARALSIAEFVAGDGSPAKGSGELVTAVDIPVSPLGVGSAYVKFVNVANLYPICGVAVSVWRDTDGRVKQARVAVTGAGSLSSRRDSLETWLVANGLPGAPVSEVISVGECVSDLAASAEYRSHLADALATDAIKAAFARSGASGN